MLSLMQKHQQLKGFIVVVVLIVFLCVCVGGGWGRNEPFISKVDFYNQFEDVKHFQGCE